MKTNISTPHGIAILVLFLFANLYFVNETKGIESEFQLAAVEGSVDTTPSFVSTSTPSPSGTRGTSIVDSTGGIWTVAATGQTLRNGVHMGGGTGSEYLYIAPTVYVKGGGGTWYSWTSNGWVYYGMTEPVIPPVQVTPASTKFSIGGRVQTTASVNARALPTTSATVVALHPTNDAGSVVGGPTAADGYNWWNIDYDTGGDGWTAEDFLTNATGTTSPTITVSDPSVISYDSSVTLLATALDNVGIVGVQFKLNGANLGSEDISSPYSTSWSTAGLPAGVYTITAVARDAAGNEGTAQSISVTVPAATYPVTLEVTGSGSGTVSGAGSFTEGANVTLTATASSNSTFLGWSPTPCNASFTMPAHSLNCKANFNLSQVISTSTTDTLAPSVSITAAGSL